VPRLQRRRKELLAAEADTRRGVAYETAKAERDRLAAELADIYAAFADKMAELLPRIDANDPHVRYINDHALPWGAEPLRVAELVAHDLPSFNPKPYTDVPRITRELRLSTFKYLSSERYVWPHRYR
jgi:hypothetical protein